MEQKLVKVPFEVEMAKKITNGEVEGRIVTRRGDNIRIVCWDYKSMSGDYPILALINQGKQEAPIPYSKEGRYNVYGYFSEDCLDLMLEIPECMTFKDGDILYCKGIYNWIFIYRSNGGDKTSCYAAVMDKSSAVFLGLCVMSDEEVKDLRFATESEKQKLIDALKASKEPKAKDCLKMLGIEVKPECKFKPFDKVLVRDDDENSAWSCNLFSGKNEDGTYMCIGGYWDMCIPYNDQTKHLLGTTDNWEE